MRLLAAEVEVRAWGILYESSQRSLLVQEGRFFMRHMRHTDVSVNGFTIPELIVVISIMGIIISTIMSILIHTYVDVLYLNNQVTSNNELSDAFWFMDDNVSLASRFLMTVPSPFVDTYGPHDSGTSGSEAWSYKGDSATSRVLITKRYATNNNSLTTSRGPVYENTVNFDCTTQMRYQPQLPYISIFFLKNGTLYRRVLTDTSTPLCPGNSQYQRQSCPPYLNKSTWNASCKANDEVLAMNISAFKVDYYQQISGSSGVQIDPNYTSTDPTTLDAADYILVTLTSSYNNRNQNTSMQLRITKVNS